MAFTDFTRLRAINRMLRAAGEFPVNSLSDDGVNDTVVAEDTLNEASLQVQMDGLVCNTQEATLNPDASNHIALPVGVLKVTHVPQSGESLVRLSSRGRRLWDMTDSTDEFTIPITVSMIVGLEFEDLPIYTRFQIAEIAARAYQMEVVGEPYVDRVLAERSAIARIAGRKGDMQARQANLLRDNPDLARTVNRGPNRPSRR